MDIARRSFLRGRIGDQPAPFRPPWAKSEAEFAELCSRCGDCVTSCPTGLLTGARGRLPQAVFAPAYCDFCACCVDACQTDALSRTVFPPWQLRAVFSSTCLTHVDVICRTCGEACDAAAILFPPQVGGIARPRLDEEACTGCGECLPVCPTGAIRIGHSVALESHP